MKTVLFLLAIFITNYGSAQYEDVKKFMQEGVLLHDEGKYKAAIAKYDETLAIGPRNMDLQFEKSLNLYSAKKYDDAKKLCEKMIDDFKGLAGLQNVCSTLGRVYDDMDEPKKAIKTYNKGIAYFPDFICFILTVVLPK